MTKRDIKKVSETGTISPEDITTVVRAVHVAPVDNGWQVRKAGKRRIAKDFSTKEAAVTYAHNIGSNRGVDIIIHTKGGVIFVENKTIMKPNGK